MMQRRTGEKRVIEATGVGRVSVQTTIATVQLSVESRGPKADEVQSEVSRKSSELLSYLGASGVTKMQTQGIQLNPRFTKESNNVNNVTGYVCSNTVSVEVSAEKCGPLLDGVVSAGANRILNVSFKATDKVVAEARLTAIEDAVRNAKDEATAAARALGCKLGDALTVQIKRGFGMFGSSPNGAFGAPAAGFGKAVTEQEQNVSANVEVQFVVQ